MKKGLQHIEIIFERTENFRTDVYLKKVVPIDRKICQNAFQTIRKVHFLAPKSNLRRTCWIDKSLLLIWSGFGRATAKRISKSELPRQIALQIDLS